MAKTSILFDNDGVLVETEVWYFRATQEAINSLGVTLREDEYLKLMAEGITAWTLAEAKGCSPQRIAQARHKRNERYQHFLRSEDLVIPDVTDIITELAQYYRMGIITTSRRVDFEIIHKAGMITKHMEFVLCEGEYARAKPHPDPYLEGLNRLKEPKESVMVVEDSQRGLTAARRAGIDCTVVHNHFTRGHDFTGATHRIGTLHELEALLK